MRMQIFCYFFLLLWFVPLVPIYITICSFYLEWFVPPVVSEKKFPNYFCSSMFCDVSFCSQVYNHYFVPLERFIIIVSVDITICSFYLERFLLLIPKNKFHNYFVSRCSFLFPSIIICSFHKDIYNFCSHIYVTICSFYLDRFVLLIPKNKFRNYFVPRCSFLFPSI
jgi:hypothetical protein